MDPTDDNAVRLPLHALAYNLDNFMRALALPEEVEHWSLTTLREKLVKIGAKVTGSTRMSICPIDEVDLENSVSAAAADARA